MATAPARQPPILNLPNLLTLSRLVLAVFLFVCIAGEHWGIGLMVFLLAAFTDWLDGYLARKQGTASAFGRNFDPLVDKVLICGSFIYLLPVPAALLMPWMVTVIVGRELIITGLRGFLETAGAHFGADWLGKIKMTMQCAVLIAVLLWLSLQNTISGGNWLGWLEMAYVILLYTMLAVTVASGVQYLWKAALLWKEW